MKLYLLLAIVALAATLTVGCSGGDTPAEDPEVTKAAEEAGKAQAGGAGGETRTGVSADFK